MVLNDAVRLKLSLLLSNMPVSCYIWVWIETLTPSPYRNRFQSCCYDSFPPQHDRRPDRKTPRRGRFSVGLQPI